MKRTLIITEKPDAAKRIAIALDSKGNARKKERNGVPYYVATQDKELIVISALGHLYTVAGKSAERDRYPVFNFKWVPRYLVEKKREKIRVWIETISTLAKEADTYINACDYDIEGSLIGYFILKNACKNKEKIAKRMKYSTLTKEELLKSFSKLLPHLDFDLVEAGRARHEVDWLYGVNLSRALTLAAKKWSGIYTTHSTGRVQGPSLSFLVKKEKTIRCFVPTPYWSVYIVVNKSNSIFKAEIEKGVITTKRVAQNIRDICKGKNGIVERMVSKKNQQLPPIPFDLGSLQREAYKLFGFTPLQTLKIAQKLYLDALISYPRTSSQELPNTIDPKAILKKLGKNTEFSELTKKLLQKSKITPRKGEKKDSAHPAIYPTGNLPRRRIKNTERKIWDLVVRRFMAVFGEPAIMENMEVYINIEGYHFVGKGRRTLKEGWRQFYGRYGRMREVVLPSMNEGEKINIKNVCIEDKFTKPPPRYNPSSLLQKLEEAEIGTKSTRAGIIQTLYKRKYILGKRCVVTNLGFSLFEVLEKYCPTVLSVQLTNKLEDEMNKIQKNRQKREHVLVNTIQVLRPILERIKEKEESIGKKLSIAMQRARLEERIIGTCPICNTGKLITIYSRKTGKRFVGCTNFFQDLCKASFPLPQRGTIKPRNKKCLECGWPTVTVQTKKKRPWNLCFNPKCPKKK